MCRPGCTLKWLKWQMLDVGGGGDPARTGRQGVLDLPGYRVRVDGDMHAIVRGNLVLDSIALLGSSRAPSVADLVQ